MLSGVLPRVETVNVVDNICQESCCSSRGIKLVSHTIKSRETEKQTQRRNFCELLPPGSVPRNSRAETAFTLSRRMGDFEAREERKEAGERHRERWRFGLRIESGKGERGKKEENHPSVDQFTMQTLRMKT